MLLEYIRPEFFRTLASMQAAEGGQPKALMDAETLLRESSVSTDAEGVGGGSEHETTVVQDSNSKIERLDSASQHERLAETQADNRNGRMNIAPDVVLEDALPAEVQPWMADPWTRTWIAADPPLTDVDLGPYFFVAHDRVGALAGIELRLSPAAREVLNRLLSTGTATQEIGLRRVADLSAPDTVAVFENLAQRARQAETLDDRSPQNILFKLMDRRPELLPQLVALYQSLPETKITVRTPPALVLLTNGTPSAEAARTVIERWSRSGQKSLAQAASAALRRTSK